MNKKLILGISIGVSITSILVGSIIFAVESNKYKGYKVVYNNVAYSATQRKNMDIDEYSYKIDDCSFKYEDDYVYVKLFGACSHCGYQDYTLNDNVYELIKEKVPTCKGVLNVEI